MNFGTTKKCTRCGETKPATREFFGSAPSGNLKGFCRTCMNKASRERDEREPENRKKRDLKRAHAGNGVRRSFPVEFKQQLWKGHDGLCLCCFEQIDRPEDGEVDHMTPLAKGGRDDPSNFMLAHAQCKREKHSKTLPEHWEWRVKVGKDRENLGQKHGLLALWVDN